MTKDYTIEGDQIIPRPNNQFEYGDRWVQCHWCKVTRPLEKLAVHADRNGEKYAGCKNLDECSSSK